MRTSLERFTRGGPQRRKALLGICTAAILASCSADSPTTPTAAFGVDARAKPTLAITPPEQLPLPSGCPNFFPVGVNERGTVVGFSDFCPGPGRQQAFRLYATGIYDSLPKPYGQAVHPISVGRHDEVYAQVQNPDPNGAWLVAVIDANNRISWLRFPADGRTYSTLGPPNDRGTFLIDGSVTYGTREYFLWNGLGKFEPLPPPPSGQRFDASGLNDREVVVGTIHAGDQAFAATWSRGEGYVVLPQPSSFVYGSWGAMIDARGRVYGQVLVPLADSTCPYWSPGVQTAVPAVWNGRDTVQLLATDLPRCRTNVWWRATADAGLAVGTLIGDAPDLPLAPSFAFVATVDGRVATAPCPVGHSCQAAGIDRRGGMVGHMLDADRNGQPLVWRVDAKR